MSRAKTSNDKGQRLVTAFNQLLDEKSYDQVTLADIAQRAEVPLGNVHYYFKTKKSMALKVRELRGVKPASTHVTKAIQQQISDLELSLLEVK